MFVSTPRRLFLLLVAGLSLPACGAGLGEARVILRGHVPEAVSRLTPVGRLPGTTNLSLAIGVPLRNQAGLDEFLRQLHDPQSTNYHRYLTSEQFTDRFGPTEQQYRSVMEFARNSGFAVVGTFSNRLVLDVAASAAHIERAFKVTLRVYHHPTEGRDFFAPDTEPSVPASVPIADMWGLSDFARPRPLVHTPDPMQNDSGHALGGSGPGGSYRGRDFRNAYAPGAANIGLGQTVAVVEFDGYYTNDITTYESKCGYTNVPVQNVLIDGVTNNPGYSGVPNAVLEVSLDIEVAIAMAPGLSQVLVYMGNNPYDVLNRIATDNTARQISCSWAFSKGPTFSWGHPGSKTLDSQLQQMDAQGQSFFQASGDSDAYTGSGSLSTSSGPIPVDSIYVTSVGGTTLTMTNSGAAWVSETVWNWGGNTGTGGGVSPNYSIPSWQAPVDMSSNSGSTVNRNIPDVALTADGIYVVYNNGIQVTGVGGTSVAAPLWAGFTALVNQQSAAGGTSPVGFLNPALYAIGTGPNYSACFHDITSGNNIGANTPGLYVATNGYDLCTGWGTPNGTNLMNALAPAACVLVPPLSQTATNGNNVNLSVIAGGQPPFGYNWLFNGTNLPASGNVSGVNSNILTLTSVTLASSGGYSVVVTNGSGAVTSSVATLTVVFPPFMVTQPANQNVPAGSNALFTATASGALPLAYRWQKGGVNLSDGGNVIGATSNTLTLSAVSLGDSGNYALVVTNIYGSTTSTVASLTVEQGPVIAAPLVPQTVECGSNASFSVGATGTAPLTYQWSEDGTLLASSTSSSFSLSNAHLPNHTISVVVTNLYGSATSSVPLLVQDTLAPVITLNGSNPLYVELGTTFTDPGAIANDLCMGPVQVSVTGAINPNTVGTNSLLYSAGDGNGNTNTTSRTVIVRDTTPPTISSSFTNLTLVADTNCTAVMPDVTGTNFITATDLSEPLTITQTPTNNSILPIGTNIVLLSVADAYANTAYSTNQIIVADQTPPSIATGPQSQTNNVGDNTILSVTASACTPLMFQWFFTNSMLIGQTNNTLTLSNLTTAAAGDYYVVVTAGGGSSTSQIATLTVNLLGSSLALTSSENPSGFKDAVSFAALITPTNATGSVQFLTNGVAFDIEPIVAGQVVSTNVASLPRGTNLVTAAYAGDANTLPSLNALSQVVTNHPPTAVPVFYTRAPGALLDIAITNLAANWSDLDGDTVSLADVGVSTNGVILANDGITLVYSNLNNVDDQFVCTISDGWGGTNFQTVSISLVQLDITRVLGNPDGSVTLNFLGGAGSTYILQSSTNLFPTDWLPLVTNALGLDGLGQFTDSAATNFQQRFYRLQLVP